MRAVVLTSYGDPDVLTVSEVPEPVPGPEEVLVDVVATALNRADLIQRRGHYPEPGAAREHDIPGMELSGRVAAVGRHARGVVVQAAVVHPQPGLLGAAALACDIASERAR